MVAAGIDGFFAVAARWWGWLVKKRETELAAKEEPVSIGVEAVIGEPAGQGV